MPLISHPIAVGTDLDQTYSSGGIDERVQAAAWRITRDTRTGSGAGSLSAVSPIVITNTLGLTISYNSVLTLTYVPEPTTSLLLAAGLAAIAARKARRRA